MRIDKGYIRASSYVGIFMRASDNFILVPDSISEKEYKHIEQLFNSKMIKCSMAGSQLIGVLSVALKNKIAVSDILTEKEISYLRNQGLQVHVIKGVSAIGNLVCVNEFGGICSKALTEAQVKELETFFEMPFLRMTIAKSELIGASCVATSKGFVVNPGITEEEFKKIQQVLKIRGQLTSSNYGDRFVGNGIVANNQAVIVGDHTTTHELIRIDEAFRE
ncbi:MAG: translation initiation factor IF-6 [Candidatus Diapherotrites archaeon CG08_land_8_20_14_0_20_34_12]|nr:MAG: translation initiation factor IF-6 [Candidatus Diapherotrites archaeon CG08_land_8_20_14_0_20_34_12]